MDRAALIKVDVQMPKRLEDRVLQGVWWNGCLWGAVAVLLAFVVLGGRK